MPITVDVDIVPVGQEQFHAVDRVVMGEAFGIHNSMGRFFDERVYQEEMAHCCRQCGFSADREVSVRLAHLDYEKILYLDVLVEGSVIYELKTVEALSKAHEQQLINYLLLTGLKHGKLVNFRSSSVESRFVSTTISDVDRMDFEIIEDGFGCLDETGDILKRALIKLFEDWGAFLDFRLYRDALMYLLTGSQTDPVPVDIRIDGRRVGKQKMNLLNSKTAWHISSVKRQYDSYKKHLMRLLNHTDLSQMHWINLNNHTITLTTIYNSPSSNDSDEK